MISNVAFTFSPRKGIFPVTIAYRTTPAHQMSTPRASYLRSGWVGRRPHKNCARFCQRNFSVHMYYSVRKYRARLGLGVNIPTYSIFPKIRCLRYTPTVRLLVFGLPSLPAREQRGVTPRLVGEESDEALRASLPATAFIFIGCLAVVTTAARYKQNINKTLQE